MTKSEIKIRKWIETAEKLYNVSEITISSCKGELRVYRAMLKMVDKGNLIVIRSNKRSIITNYKTNTRENYIDYRVRKNYK